MGGVPGIFFRTREVRGVCIFFFFFFFSCYSPVRALGLVEEGFKESRVVEFPLWLIRLRTQLVSMEIQV